MGNKNARFAIYAIAGVYLLYMVKMLAENLSTAGSEKWIMIVFIGLFSVIGSGMIIAGIRQVIKNRKNKE
ncbi:MAG: hypothetical protein ACRC3H_03395 [Lachnospiraceae bacterium]